MKDYDVTVYYSGHITVRVEAPDKCTALVVGRAKAVAVIAESTAAMHGRSPRAYLVELLDSLLPWMENDTVKEAGQCPK